MQVVASISYTKVKEIGGEEGKNSRVFLVDEPQLGGRLVVKEISKENLIASNVASFFVEAQAMFSVPHPNVVPILYACETENSVCLAMPYFPKGSLQARLADGSPLGVSETLRLADGILAAAGQIHEKNYIHFDIKPTNILIGPKETPMIADFGQARMLNRFGFAAAPRMYVPAMPPEVIENGAGNQAADIYQVGLLLWRCLLGERRYRLALEPYRTPTELCKAIVKGKFPLRKAFLPHVPARLVTLIRRALKVDPAQRFHSASAFRTDLGRVKPTLDWQCVDTEHQTEWTAERQGQPAAIVRMIAKESSWSTEAWTDNGASRRRARTSDLWREGLTEADAIKHVVDALQAFE